VAGLDRDVDGYEGYETLKTLRDPYPLAQVPLHQEKIIFNIVLHSSDSTFSSVDNPPVY
jgi:hypothetical protein